MVENDKNNLDEQYYFREWDNIVETKSNGKQVLRLPQKTVDSLIKKQYGVFGHSAVQICSWTKKAMTNNTENPKAT